MCSVVPALLAAGGAVSAFSSLQQGSSALAASQRQAGYLDQQSNQVLEQGDFNSDQSLIQGQQAIGSQRTGAAAGNIDVNSGSAQRNQDSTQDLSEQDALTIRNNAAREAWGYRTQAQETLNQGSAAKRSSFLSGGGSLLTAGAGSYATHKRGL